jgi:hypothetical protein
MLRYKRAPSKKFKEALKDEKRLRFLLSGLTGGDKGPLDVQFRENDRLMFYSGGTCLLGARYLGARVRFSASDTYCLLDPSTEEKTKKELFAQEWSVDDDKLPAAISTYLSKVSVQRQWKEMEGDVQMRWADLKRSLPWTPLDREAVLGYHKGKDRTNQQDIEDVRNAWQELHRRQGGRWPQIPLSKAKVPDGCERLMKRPRELDQLAVDKEGRLVLIELKYASPSSSVKKGSASSVYCAPLQLLQYVHEWHRGFASGDLLNQLQELVDSKVELGLLPPTVPKLTGALRPVVAFGDALPAGGAKAKFETVLEVANGFLPSGVPRIEVWNLETGGEPRQLYGI